MDALGQYDSDNGSLSEGESNPSEDDDVQAKHKLQTPAAQPKTKLPSAAELLNKSHKASYLAHARDPPVATLEASNSTTQASSNKQIISRAAVLSNSDEATETEREAAIIQTKSRSSLATSLVPPSQPAPGLQRHTATAAEKKKHGRTSNNSNKLGTDAAAAVTAKDRVKRQRLRGQAGIGDQFRSWRSDEEMKLRQQFDT